MEYSRDINFEKNEKLRYCVLKIKKKKWGHISAGTS